MEKIVVLEFLKPGIPPYNPGETAGFPELDAERLLRIPGGFVKARPDIVPRVATRSPGLDPPSFSIQQLAGVIRQASEEQPSERRK